MRCLLADAVGAIVFAFAETFFYFKNQFVLIIVETFRQNMIHWNNKRMMMYRLLDRASDAQLLYKCISSIKKGIIKSSLQKMGQSISMIINRDLVLLIACIVRHYHYHCYNSKPSETRWHRPSCNDDKKSRHPFFFFLLLLFPLQHTSTDLKLLLLF